MKTVRPLLVAVLLVIATAAATVWLTNRSIPPEPAAQPIASVLELMSTIVDPSADVVFESVGVISTPAGVTERAPATDEEWWRIESSALMLAEAGNLLKMRGRRVADDAAAGDASADVMLRPDDIRARIDANRARWDELASALTGVAIQARDAARARSVQGLYDVGGVLDQACENCHRQFWYPDAVSFLPGSDR